mmetsp:Transcript_8348/g.25088  ORF Transcript_8348/g.25088 Transcript_8348/m.25088 type:complete len:360 (+) Transcript_8348:138-1217(+)
MSSKQLRIAALGAGIFAQETHAPALSNLITEGLVRIVVSWSRTEKSATELSDVYAKAVIDGKKPDVCYGDEALEQVLSRDDVDAVVIALPIYLQPEIVLKALHAGKHVLSEKPLAGSTDDARRTIEKRKQEMVNSKPYYCIAENYRFEKGLRYAAKQVSECCGEILSGDVVASVPFPRDSKYEKTQWRRDSKHEGGVLVDSAVHFMAGLRMITGGTCIKTCSITALKSDHLPKVDTVAAILAFKEGYAVTFSASYASIIPRFVITIIGSEGNVVIERGNIGADQGYIVTTKTKDNETTEKFPFSGVDQEMKAFALHCLGSDPMHPDDPTKLSAEEAFADMAIIENVITGGGKFIDVPTL